MIMAPDSQSKKSVIRRQLLDLRNSLMADQIKEKSGFIKQKLFSTEAFNRAKTVFFYVSAGSEVRTHEMIKEALKSKRVAVPVTDKGKKKLIASQILDFSELAIRHFSILEPKKEFVRPIDRKASDLIIVPGIAFDEEGNRIGYGYGYFDSFLEKISVPKIALAYEMQLVKKIRSIGKDARVDFIVTEKRVIKCR